jgi:hypothetical protein
MLHSETVQGPLFDEDLISRMSTQVRLPEIYAEQVSMWMVTREIREGRD